MNRAYDPNQKIFGLFKNLISVTSLWVVFFGMLYSLRVSRLAQFNSYDWAALEERLMPKHQENSILMVVGLMAYEVLKIVDDGI